MAALSLSCAPTSPSRRITLRQCQLGASSDSDITTVGANDDDAADKRPLLLWWHLGIAGGIMIFLALVVLGEELAADMFIPRLSRRPRRWDVSAEPPWAGERAGSTPGQETRHARCHTVNVSSDGGQFAACSRAVKGAMAMPREMLQMHLCHRCQRGPWAFSNTEAKKTPAEFQMLRYLLDGDAGVCPKPCFSPRLAQRQMATLCPPPGAAVPPPPHATAYNGISWPQMCFEGDREEHILLIGDWGGAEPGAPANNLLLRDGKKFWFRREFKWGIDDKAQFLVALQLSKFAAQLEADGNGPRYVLNVGDNFYWGGCLDQCATRSVDNAVESYYKAATEAAGPRCHQQFYSIFESMYFGPGINGVPWLSVLGNHDYGGHQYFSAWDLQIAYTWAPSGRWVLPAQYWHQQVSYPSKDFTIDYYFIDTNIMDTAEPSLDQNHNLCGDKYNNFAGVRSCAPIGPKNTTDCLRWFRELWTEQVAWLDRLLKQSSAEWQIIVTHIPLEKCSHYPQAVDDVRRLAEKYGIDLVIAGHRHRQELHPSGFGSWCPKGGAGVPYVVTGGGGGILSEYFPDEHSSDYGFMDMLVSKHTIRITSYNHNGFVLGHMTLTQRRPGFKIIDPQNTTEEPSETQAH
eukprot:TRINITY_DN1895_c0_g1_i1.p1 TRINITY_DN1895_c0_g1~~TRINITY_DN1895_c0_g1_i1.p1  ORF type:complete len:630 (+),score=116.77 TRINITY_DN1895_c0_g1_i1:132-2021(+)